MKKQYSKFQVRELINDFFKRNSFLPKEMKKIKRLAMKYRIPLKPYKIKFCKKCLFYLKGKIRISRVYKIIICGSCGYRNRFPIKDKK